MSIDERLGRIFRETLSVEMPAASTDIIKVGLLDSLALVTLLFEVENEFDIVIPLENLDIDDVRTVERIAALIEGLTTDRNAPRLAEHARRP